MRSESLSILAIQIVVTVREASSVTGSLSRILRVLPAFDYQKLLNKLRREGGELNRAVARIWITADDHTVRLANDVEVACANVIEATSNLPPTTLWERLSALLFSGVVKAEDRHGEALRSLSIARQTLANHIRREFDLPRLDFLASGEQTRLPDCR